MPTKFSLLGRIGAHCLHSRRQRARRLAEEDLTQMRARLDWVLGQEPIR